MKGEMKVSDVRNWVLNNQSSANDLRFADMLKNKWSVGHPGNYSLNGAWIDVWVVKELFTKLLEDGAQRFRAMECDVVTYFKDNPAIEPSTF